MAVRFIFNYRENLYLFSACMSLAVVLANQLLNLKGEVVTAEAVSKVLAVVGATMDSNVQTSIEARCAEEGMDMVTKTGLSKLQSISGGGSGVASVATGSVEAEAAPAKPESESEEVDMEFNLFD